MKRNPLRLLKATLLSGALAIGATATSAQQQEEHGQKDQVADEREHAVERVAQHDRASGTAYGLTAIFDPERGEMKRYNRADAVSHKERPARLLRQRGVDPSVLAGSYVRAWSGAVGADSYRRAERWIKQRRGPISPPDDPAVTIRVDDGTGLRIHLATWSGDIGQLVGATDALSRGGMEKRWIPVS